MRAMVTRALRRLGDLPGRALLVVLLLAFASLGGPQAFAQAAGEADVEFDPAAWQGWLQALRTEALERDMVFYPFNAGITSIRARGARRVIWRLNDVAHLDGMPPGFGGIS